MKEIIKDYEGEVWCISKHLLASSMRLMEVGTKELGKGEQKKAEELFSKAYKLYSLFWGINLKLVATGDAKRTDNNISLMSESGEKKSTTSVFDKLGTVVQKAIDCCKE